jgi:predicted nucleic acid-binding protein
MAQMSRSISELPLWVLPAGRIMPRENFSSKLLFLDACCLINLLATGRLEEILNTLPFRFVTSRLIATKEVLAIARDTDEEGVIEREIIPPKALEDLEILTLMDLSTDQELDDFVRFAAELDDGEASVCALALAHGGGVATDDRKALSVLRREAPQVLTIQTPDLLHDWALRSKSPATEVARVLRSIERSARFRPRHGASRFEWWTSSR